MKKDVIYIDVEDDITSIIDKLKNADEKIVALVPPKGNAVFQSVVNLKLLKRAATSAKKQPVLVTSNQALTALAGGLNLYVAKNLQSKPVLAKELTEQVLDDDNVEVSDSPDQLSEAGTSVSLADEVEEPSNEVELSDDELSGLESEDASTDGSDKKSGAKKNKTKKIPNFDSFRKKLIIGGVGLLVIVIALFVVFGRAKSTVVIRAETTPVEVAFEANFNANSPNADPTTNNLTATAQEVKKTLSQSFTATGEKDLGEKATGTMQFINCSKDDKLSDKVRTIPAGTGVSAAGKTFITGQAVQVEPSSFLGNNCLSNKKSDSVNVVAQSSGDSFNLSARDYSVSGFSTITGKGSQMSGGTSKIVKVVSQDDINKAKDQLNQQDTNAVREELQKKFSGDITVLSDTFATVVGNITSEPAVGAEANEGRLTVEATYTLLGTPNADINAALDAFVVGKMTDKDRQRVYDNGFKNMKLEKLNSTDKTATYKIASLAQYGPQFDTEDLKNQVAGKKFGEARSYLQDLPGVKGVDIKLSPFWARKLPGAGNIKISVEVDKNSTGQ